MLVIENKIIVNKADIKLLKKFLVCSAAVQKPVKDGANVCIEIVIVIVYRNRVYR